MWRTSQPLTVWVRNLYIQSISSSAASSFALESHWNFPDITKTSVKTLNTSSWHTERELVLLKIRAPPGPTRTEVMQLIDIFRARVVDVSDRSMTIAVTGDAGKVRPLPHLLPSTFARHPSTVLSRTLALKTHAHTW